MATNILTIDVEDWYMDVDIRHWGDYQSRLVQSTQKVLSILAEMNTRATFFVLGYVGERFPRLVEGINMRGHEIATHGYSHKRVMQLSPSEFEADLIKSIKILENLTHGKVLGHRAREFTIMETTSWAVGILKRSGLRYDSSIFPVKTHLYGVPDAPRFPYRISSSDIKLDDPGGDFWELPLSVYQIPVIKKNIPIAGGFYLRFFPYRFVRYAIRKINKQNQPAVCYLHPWELDPELPRLRSLSWDHYYGLSRTEERFRRLLADFQFTSVQEYLSLE
jgi:polysaccharide deacetylase family protein (PEP-CTERM system associated)